MDNAAKCEQLKNAQKTLTENSDIDSASRGVTSRDESDKGELVGWLGQSNSPFWASNNVSIYDIEFCVSLLMDYRWNSIT